MDTTSSMWHSPLGEAIGPYLLVVLLGVFIYLGYKGLFPKKLKEPAKRESSGGGGDQGEDNSLKELTRE